MSERETLEIPDKPAASSTSPMNSLLGGLVQTSNSDLMSRLQSFLPEMAAANENLDDAEVIDGDCVKLSPPKEKGDRNSDSDSDDNGNGDGESADPNANDDESPSSGQRIELTVALGDFSESAIAKMEDGEAPPSSRARLSSDASDSPMKNFLKRELTSTGQGQITSEVLPKKKKPLIEFVD